MYLFLIKIVYNLGTGGCTGEESSVLASVHHPAQEMLLHALCAMGWEQQQV